MILSGCGGALSRSMDKRDKMFYAAHADQAVIHAYDLDQSPDDAESKGVTRWPMYRIYPEAVVTELIVAPNQKWVYSVNNLGRVEGFESRPTGRLERLPSIDLPEGGAVTLAFAPNSERFYVATDAGKVFGYLIAKDGSAAQDGVSVDGPTAPSKILVHPNGESLVILASSDSKIWTFQIESDGTLAPIATLDVPGGPSEAIWNADGSRLYVSCQDSNQIAQFAVLGDGQLQEQSRVAGPSKPGAPVLSANGQYLFVPSRQGPGQIWRYQVGASLTILGDPFPTNHSDQGSAVLNPFGYLSIVNVGDHSYTEYIVYEDGSILRRRRQDLEVNASQGVYRVNQ